MPGAISETIGSVRRGREVRADRVDSALSTVALPAGALVTYATGGKLKLPTSGAEVIAGMGISIYRSSKTPVSGSDLEFAAGDLVEYVEGGDIDVIVEEAVTPTSAVFARHTANGAGKLQLGAFRTDADSGNATLVSGARFISSTSAAGVATLRINRPTGDASVAAAFERKALRRTFAFDDTDVAVAATSAVITFGDPLPINAVVESVHATFTDWTDGSSGTFEADVGVLSGDDDRFTPTALDIDGAASGELNQTVNLPGNNSGATTQLAVKFGSDVNLSTLTGGTMVLTVYYYVPSSITVVEAP